MLDPSHVFDLYHSSRQQWILNSPSGRPGIKPRNLIVPSQIRLFCAMMGTPTLIFFSFFFFFFFLGPKVRHMEAPRLGAELELELPVYTKATAKQDGSCVFDLHHSIWCRSLTYWTRLGIEPGTSWFLVRFISTMGTPKKLYILNECTVQNVNYTSIKVLYTKKKFQYRVSVSILSGTVI